MNAKTLEAVRRHGNALLAAFPDAVERDPVALCKKLRRIETVAHRGAEDYCNGTPCYGITGKVFHFGQNETDWEDFTDIIQGRVQRVLGIDKDGAQACGFFVNGDARGCALKLSSEWTDAYNAKVREAGQHELQLNTDWGHYAMLAPNLTND